MAYYAPFYRPMGYYNPSIPQDNQNMQGGQPFSQPIQQPQQMQMQTPIQQMPMVQQMPTNDMLWVLGQTEAESYLVAPNNSVTLWDKNKDTVYIKSVNMQGVPSMRILDYTERTAENEQKQAETHVCNCGDKFVSLEDFRALQGKIEALESELDELKAKPKAKAVKNVKTEDDENG
ncbi:MAG: hypothetical protein J6Q27_02830 [Clostridia bacterium]|nr:hypothetical protein [Clostridia bacterium]